MIALSSLALVFVSTEKELELAQWRPRVFEIRHSQ
jgi:hypothetical protein